MTIDYTSPGDMTGIVSASSAVAPSRPFTDETGRQRCALSPWLCTSFRLDGRAQSFYGTFGNARSQLIPDIFEQPESVPTVSREELLRLIDEGSVTLIDVRPPEEYVLGHLPCAQNIPLEEIATRLRQLHPNREEVAYCHGPCCIPSEQAIKLLRSRGMSEKRDLEGVSEQSVAGLPYQ